MTPRLRNTTLQIQTTTKTEDSLVFGWEGRHRSIFNRSIFQFFFLLFRFNITLPHAFEFALLLLIASSSRLLRVGRETEVLLAMKHSEPFLFFIIIFSFIHFISFSTRSQCHILYNGRRESAIAPSMGSQLLNNLFLSSSENV